jgi:hypothetical protein
VFLRPWALSVATSLQFGGLELVFLQISNIFICRRERAGGRRRARQKQLAAAALCWLRSSCSPQRGRTTMYRDHDEEASFWPISKRRRGSFQRVSR